MKLNKISLKNFRCFEEIGMKFHPEFNILVGVNGTGKTAILEAIRIAIGSLYSDFDKIEGKIASPNITVDDVRLHNGEMQYEVNIASDIQVEDYLSPDNSQFILWDRNVERYNGATKYVNAQSLKGVSKEIQSIIRKGEEKTIPLIAHYPTDRFKKEKKTIGLEADGSRLRGYYNALDLTTNIGFFLNIYKTETLWELQHSLQSEVLASVNNAVMSCVDDCRRIYHDVKKDELIIQLTNDELIPFHLLSDGVRNILAMVMELAFRSYLLNPHLGVDAPLKTTGIVLIDEIDLHLHPAWQKKVINDLRRAFPNIQFIVSTHAPLVIGSLKKGEIFSISDRKVFNFPIQYGKDVNSILNVMGTEEMDEHIKQMLNDYFLMIERGEGNSESALTERAELESLLGYCHPELERADLMLKLF